MFKQKQKQLIEISQSTSGTTTMESPFVAAANKKSARTLSGNGALKYSTTGNDFVDQFGKLGSYKTPRTYEEIANDMATLWAINPLLTVCFTLFIRMITRVVVSFDGIKTASPQRGAGLKNEGIMRMMWININHRDTFWKNFGLFVMVGSWKDVFVMLSLDLQYNGWKSRMLDWDKFGQAILVGLENPNTTNLVKKYLPQLKSNAQCKTLESQANNIIAKWLCSLLFGGKNGDTQFQNYKKYRQLKTSGTAHTWQQHISRKDLIKLDFNTVHGRALAQMVSGKFLANNGLEKRYEEWIANKPIAKFTGYVTELFIKTPEKKYQIDTLNAQFNGLIETAKKSAITATNFISVVDTSDSMSTPNSGIKMENVDVAKSLALFFSQMLNKGPFANAWFEFNSFAVLHTIKGSTPWEKWCDMKRYSHTGSTNFISVVEYLIDIRKKNPKLAESDFPQGFLVMSDMEFNPTQFGTNTETVFKRLRTVFSKEFVNNFKLVFWNLQSNAYGRGTGEKFETHGNEKNVFYFSGYDGSIVAFLTGVEGKAEKPTPTTAEELFKAAMDQEVLKLVEI